MLQQVTGTYGVPAWIKYPKLILIVKTKNRVEFGLFWAIKHAH